MKSLFGWTVVAAASVMLALPAQAAWKEARSRHFIVYTEGTPTSAVETAKKLEKFEFMLRAVSGSTKKSSPVPLKVFLMPTRKAVQDTMYRGGGEGVAGYYSASSRGPIAVGTRSELDRSAPGYTRAGTGLPVDLSSDVVLLHEYTHHFMFQHFPAAYPTWYVEGFAEYYGTTKFLPNDVIEIGHVAAHRYGSFEFNDWLPVGRLLGARDYSDLGINIHLLYAEGWLLVHYLGNTPARQGQLGRYLNLLNAGVGYEEARDQAFGPGAKALDAELRAYSKKGRLTAIRLPFKPIDVGQISVRALSPAEDALVDQEIKLGRGLYASEAKSFASKVRQIASRFPRDPYALGMLAESEWLAENKQAAAAVVQEWLSVAPGSGRAMLLQARLATDALTAAKSTDAKAWDSARQQILAANKLSPTDPMPYEAYYDSFPAQGVSPPASAQNALFRAFELVPQDEDIRYKLVADYEARDMLEEAITVIKPIAVEGYDPDDESKSEQAKRERRKVKYRQAGEAIDGERPIEMLRRLEKKLAAKNNPPNGSGTP